MPQSIPSTKPYPPEICGLDRPHRVPPRLHLLHVREESAVEVVKALEGILLTTLPVGSMADAKRIGR